MKEKKTKKNEELNEQEISDQETPQENNSGENETEDSTVDVKVEESNEFVDSAALKIEELQKENKELQERLLRRMAEFENYKRRTENEQMNLIKFAAEGFIVDMLPIYDDLERSLNHVDEENKDSLIQGLKMVFDKFGKVLDKQGVKRIDAKDKEFDFNFHEALMRQESKDYPPDTVITVLDNGYMYKDKVIKHAKVVVSAAPAEEETAADENKANNEEE